MQICYQFNGKIIIFQQQGNASSEKKGVLEGLDREELIRKCKGLLGIAQKAKKAKDGLLF